MEASERHTQRVKALRAAYEPWLYKQAPSRFVFIDETASNLAMHRRYGRALRCKGVVDQSPRNWGGVHSH